MKDKNQNKIGFVGFILALIVLGLVGYLLYNFYLYLYQDAPLDYILIAILFVSIMVIVSMINKFVPSISKKPKVDNSWNNKLNNNNFNDHDFSDGTLNANHEGTESDIKTDSSFKANSFSSSSKTSKGMNKNLVPLVVLVLVFVGFYLFQTGFFADSNPVGRWIFQMNEGTDVGGAINLTDYWYMEFYENGDLDIGWKNVDMPEESQGSGTWHESEGVIYLTINYNYGDTVNTAMVIKGNELVDAQTNVRSGYFRE